MKTLMIIMFALCFALFVLLIVMTIRLLRAFDRFRIKKPYTTALEAPSVSVCIPARNETHAMTQCLERVLASDYEKLEIIVFDDNSVDDTSVLIRSFAHAGVRFVPGKELPAGWLGKNHALEVLAREASGTYVMFMDVDTNINTTTISQLVSYAMTENAEMVSVIPGRADTWRSSVLFGHLRYLWELLLSRKTMPAAASSLWMINRRTLLDTFEGFTRMSGDVAPESKLAALLGAGAYRCLVNVPTLGVTYEKKWLSQMETGRRLLYPMAGGTPLGASAALVLLGLLNLPFFIVVGGLIFDWSLLHTLMFAVLLSFMAFYAYYAKHLWARAWLLGGLLWPIVILQEFILMAVSIWGYARHSITWKGRPVLAHSVREQK